MVETIQEGTPSQFGHCGDPGRGPKLQRPKLNCLSSLETAMIAVFVGRTFGTIQKHGFGMIWVI